MKADILQLPASQLGECAQLTIPLLTSYTRAIINTPCPPLHTPGSHNTRPSRVKERTKSTLFNLLNPPFSYSKAPLGSAFTTTGTRLA
jgi:hypothetical protein